MLHDEQMRPLQKTERENLELLNKFIIKCLLQKYLFVFRSEGDTGSRK